MDYLVDHNARMRVAHRVSLHLVPDAANREAGLDLYSYRLPSLALELVERQFAFYEWGLKTYLDCLRSLTVGALPTAGAVPDPPSQRPELRLIQGGLSDKRPDVMA